MSKFLNKLSNKFKESGEHSSASHGGQISLQVLQHDDAVYPQPGKAAPGPGQLPPKVANVQFMPEKHQFYDPQGKKHATMRDLGFTGVLSGRIIWLWGDTLMGGTPETAHICAVDATSIGSMRAPMHSIDSKLQPNSSAVDNLIPCNQTESQGGGYATYAFGGSNIIEVAPGQGIVYYCKIHRPGGKQQIIGSGVASVVLENGRPIAHRPADVMWGDCEPCFGDVGVAFDSRDGHVYAFGHGSPADIQELNKRTYLCRAPADKAFELDAYEYWHNGKQEWTRQRFANGQNGTLNNDKEQAIFDWLAMGQSAPMWSNYFNKWMFLHATGWPASEVLCKTADKLEGPWTDHGSVAKLEGAPGKPDGLKYCVCPHPEYDPSGKTVFVTWTNDNEIYGLTITWE